MNLSAIIGLVVSVGVILMGVLLGSPLMIFFDLPAVLIVVVGTFFLLLATHGKDSLLLCSGMGRWLSGGATSSWGAEGCRKTSEVANSGGSLAITMGALGCLIGLVQMLSSMDDPSTIGPAMAVALLTTFYAALLNLLFFVPMSRYFADAAIEAEADGVTTA